MFSFFIPLKFDHLFCFFFFLFDTPFFSVQPFFYDIFLFDTPFIFCSAFFFYSALFYDIFLFYTPFSVFMLLSFCYFELLNEFIWCWYLVIMRTHETFLVYLNAIHCFFLFFIYIWWSLWVFALILSNALWSFRYIEASKERLYQSGAGGKSVASVAQAVLLYTFENILKVLHPFMPFVTEELWQVNLVQTLYSASQEKL